MSACDQLRAELLAAAHRIMEDTMTVGRWTIEPSREGIPLVFGDGKYPHDPPRVASELESALADAHTEAVEALHELVRLKDGARDDAYRAAKDAAWDVARSIVAKQ